MPERILNWLDFGPTGANVASGSTVETDGVAVTIDFAEGDSGASLHPFTLEQFVDEDEPFSADHALKIFGGGSTDGVMTTSTTTLSFASAPEEFGDRVGNMLFRINDVDTGQGDQDYVDIVTVRAFDADGNELPVDLTGGSQVIVSGQTATGNDIDDPSVTLPSDPSKSVLVSIPGPLARVEIELANGGPDQQAIWLTELKYDITLPNGPVPCFTPGTMIATPQGERRVEDLQVGGPGDHARQRLAGDPLGRSEDAQCRRASRQSASEPGADPRRRAWPWPARARPAGQPTASYPDELRTGCALFR